MRISPDRKLARFSAYRIAWFFSGNTGLTPGAIEFPIGNFGRDPGTLVFKGKFETENLIAGEVEFSPSSETDLRRVARSKRSVSGADEIRGERLAH